MIQVENLSVQAGTFVLNDVNFEIPSGACAVLMGRTGSGKTTLLEALCGLRPVLRGVIRLGNRDVTNMEPGCRGIGYVPQDRALFQTMTARENLAFGLVIRGEVPDEIQRRVGELAAMLGLEKLLDRKPQNLSGGEAQRVALGRALAIRPSFLCLDEPLSALDEETREEMYGVLEMVHQMARVTTLHVTHNPSEARRLADLVLRIENGRVSVVSGP